MKESNKYYTLIGNQDFLDDNNYPRTSTESNKTYAKCCLSKKPKRIASQSNLGVDKDSYKYYIAVNSNKEAYSPTNTNQPKANFVSRVCKDSKDYKLHSVNAYIFNKYIAFLKTGNNRALIDINRDLKS